jgi:hypothetical protein
MHHDHDEWEILKESRHEKMDTLVDQLPSGSKDVQYLILNKE